MSRFDLFSVIVWLGVGAVYPISLTLMVPDVTLETAWGPLCILGFFGYAWLLLAGREFCRDLRMRWILLGAGMGYLVTCAVFLVAAERAERGCSG